VDFDALSDEDIDRLLGDPASDEALAAQKAVP
jgi:hypothetical protein